MDTTKKILTKLVEFKYYYDDCYGDEFKFGYVSGLKGAYEMITGNRPDLYVDKEDGTFLFAYEVGMEDWEEVFEYIGGTYDVDENGDIANIRFND